MAEQRRKGRDRDPYEVARRRMVSEQLIPSGIQDKEVLRVMGSIPRHAFVAPGMEDQAYLDRPLQIGQGQTISQPAIVARMTELAQLTKEKRVLEIGTGSGYQVAILAELTQHVYSIERIRDLSIRARKTLYRLRYTNISLRIGDGTLGWPEQAPFDAIVVTAGAPVVPEALRAQLADGGRLIIPVGEQSYQELLLIVRKGASYSQEVVTGCRFVKLIGKKGWNES